MASKKPSMIDALRAKHDPHYQLAGKVESLGKDIPVQLTKLHKTLSNSFAMQRKTLTRVLGLEKRISGNETKISNLADVVINIGEEQAKRKEEQAKRKKEVAESVEEVVEAVEELAEEVGEEIPEGLDDVLDDIRGEEDGEFDAAHATPEEVEEYNSSVPMTDEEKEFVGEESKFDAVDKSVSTKTKPKKKPRIKVKKKKISVDKFKKGTPFDEGFKSRVMGQDEKGGYLSPEERKFRFKKGNDGATVDPSKLLPPDENQEEGASGPVKDILSSVISIEETLNSQYQLQLEGAKDQKKESEKKKRGVREKMLEGGKKIWDGIKQTGEAVIKPFQSIWSKILGFIQTIFFGRIFYKIIEWMGDKKNKGKIQSIIKFFKDWWPALLAGYLLFGNALSGFILGFTKTLVVWGAKLVGFIIPKLMAALVAMGPLGWGLLATGAVVAGGVYLHNKNKNKNKEGGDKNKEGGDKNVEAAAETAAGNDKNVEPAGNDKNVEPAGNDKNVEPAGGQEVQKMNKGGTVPGRGNTDTVPAMLTPGEFVMSKGAVQKYGVNTMESMNAAAGGTNKPSLLRGYNEGGMTTPMSMEDLVAAAGPSMMAFMEQHNALIDSDPEFYGEHMRIEMDRDGKMLNFGKVITNMSEWAFNEGNQMLIENEAIEPEVKEALLKEMDYVRRQTLENPNFKADYAFDINKNIPGTAANRLFLRAQADTTSPAALAGMSARDRALAMNRRGYFGGGLVQAFKGGRQVIQGLKGGGQVQGGRGRLKDRPEVQALRKNAANIQPKKTVKNITPSRKKKTTVAYQDQGGSMKSAGGTGGGNKEIPSFSATAMRSSDKIQVLGISV